MKPVASALLLLLAAVLPSLAETSAVITAPGATPRELYAASRLNDAIARANVRLPEHSRILVGTRTSSLFGSHPPFSDNASEAFRLMRSGDEWWVIGSDPSAVLYGCLELARRIEEDRQLPSQLDVTDRPALKIRGTNLFWMKQGDYDWAVTPENFPWFFDKALMLRYLDQLVENRYNTIFFWNGHPFPYFLPLAKYPEARALNDQELKRNIDQLQWFTREADRRGIWTVFHFYNIHVSPAFAKAHQAEGVHLQNPASTPLLEAYTRYCVREFVNSYPSVGLMLTAGEALHVKSEEWVRDAVVEGIKETGKHPPLIVRQWTIDPYRFRDVIKPNYDQLYTMMKHNTEMIVSPYPDPRNSRWISFGQNHIINVHENGDIKPFRWGSPVFVQQMVRIWRSMGVAGMHLYPAVSWDWPSSLDRTEPRLSTMDRDWIWLEEFGRYSWNPERSAAGEERFWKDRLARRFANAAAGKAVYNYYVKTGPIMPALQNVVNVFNMNYHPLAISQEASLNGILHSDRWEDVGDYLARPLDDFTLELFEKRFGPLGDARKRPPLSVKEWVVATLSGKTPNTLDPIRLSTLLVSMAEDAVNGLQSVKISDPEYGRFLTDARGILYLAKFYRAKLEAATEKGLYDGSGETAHYDRMLQLDAESVTQYGALDELASRTYLHATDLGYYYRWDRADKGFKEELAFYRGQQQISRGGAELVYLGLDGPMSDASRVFHWLIEGARERAGWSAQSYYLEPNLFARAKIAIVYDTFAPGFVKYQKQMENWVRNGGKLLIWDPTGLGGTGTLLEGIVFAENASLRAGNQIAYLVDDHPLLNSLSGSTLSLSPGDTLSSTIRAVSSDWRELAYTVLHSRAAGQFYTGDQTFGPRWTSLMDPVRAPVLVVRKFGAGEIAVAQMGRWSVSAGPDMETVKQQMARSPLGKFAENLVRWAGESHIGNNQTVSTGSIAGRVN
jgi:hypothetical protein